MRALPEDNLAYATLIEIGQSQGSGVVIGIENKLWLATAKHVVANNGKLIADTVRISSPSQIYFDTSKEIREIDLINYPPKYHSKSDVALIYLGNYVKDEKIENRYNVSFHDSNTSLERAKNPPIICFQDTMRSFKDLDVGNDIYVYGYPKSIGLVNVVQVEYHKPLLRRGIIAGLNPVQETIIIDCAAYPGNSGGPVVEREVSGLTVNYKLIGIVTEYVPYIHSWVDSTDGSSRTELAHSGYSVVEPIDRILELIHTD